MNIYQTKNVNYESLKDHFKLKLFPDSLFLWYWFRIPKKSNIRWIVELNQELWVIFVSLTKIKNYIFLDLAPGKNNEIINFILN